MLNNIKQVTGNSYSIAPYEVTQYSKAAQTEAFEEQDHEEADVTDEEDVEGQRGDETDTTEIPPTGIFHIRKLSKPVSWAMLCSSVDIDTVD